MSKNIVWFDARCLNHEEIILPLVYNLNYEYLLITRDMLEAIKAPHKMNLVVQINEEVQLEGLPDNITVLSDSAMLLSKAKKKGYDTAYYQRIDNQEHMNLAWEKGMHHNYLVAELCDETNIPLELLIAQLQDEDTILLKIVHDLQEAEIALGIMEVGSDGIILSTENTEEIQGVDALIIQEEIGSLELVKGTVTEVQHIGMGYRVCIDTTALMGKNEGMIIGSTSQGGLLVSSETHFLPYMELRPFRVNAGAVHSYIWTSQNMTQYLTELKGGSKVLCVDTQGNTREVSVGRAKTEMRPLLKIEVEAKGIKVNAIVQDDWHIRIFGGDGKVRNASTIRKGDELLTYICEGGRHVGIKIEEHIHEK